MLTSITDSDLTWMLGQLLPTDSVQMAKQFVADSTKRPLSANPSYEDPKDLLATLRVRATITKREGIVAHGLDALIESLEKRPKFQKIFGLAYKTDQYFGKFYFEDRENNLIGFTIIDQRQKAPLPVTAALHPA